MKRGILETEGYHGVETSYGFYVRTNRNETTDDNLVDPDNINI